MRLMLCFLILVFAVVDPALAYIGPGMGLGFIGSLFGMIAAVFIAIFGFVWYPIKRMMKGRRSAKATDDEDED